MTRADLVDTTLDLTRVTELLHFLPVEDRELALVTNKRGNRRACGKAGSIDPDFMNEPFGQMNRP